MVKENSQGLTAKYKVLLKPTDIGLLVMRRLERPHLDMSTELRRLIELGYAAERAGFILDGTVLRHAGRIWDIQPDLSGDTYSHTSPTPALQEASHELLPAQRSEDTKSEAAMPEACTAPGYSQSQGEKSDVTPKETSPLRNNLRKLSA